ncbi:MAG: DUF2905 domain-containing protein [Thermodesulfobacteriota bacterium]|nr:DUF2905 domain-containing protein [Thermodesulfobacteriota bacterium]
MSKNLILIGILFIIIGFCWPLIEKMHLGRLPGDIVLKGENYRFYLPITTSIVISLILSLILWLFRR